MTQSRLQSFVEAWAGTITGFLTSLALSPIVYPMFGHAFTFGQNVGIITVFTTASIVRVYLIRRAFNWFLHWGAK